jgi:bacterioferritin-associated ferredoxin
MVICHCLAVNDRAIAELARTADVVVDDIVAECGAGGACGGCRESIEQILSELGQEVALQAS